MQMYYGGEWRAGRATTEVRSPFDGSVVDTVPTGAADDIEAAISGLVNGAASMRRLSALQRGDILRRAAALLRTRKSELGRIITLEEGKVLSEGVMEVERAAETLDASADAARSLCGEMIPLGAAPGGAGKLGFTLRVPCGVVAAITPFNFPLNLVAHKVGPSIAAGNATLVKPASDTPLSALKLVEVLLECGLPPDGIACVTGSGSELGAAICSDSRVRKISFTGSCDVGETICRMAGLKRVTMELGSNSPVIVMDDADLDAAAAGTAASGYANAGQVCISAQRILVDRKVYGSFVDALTPRVSAITVGDPLNPGTKMGPLVRERDAARVEQWIAAAVSSGARKLLGGPRSGAILPPAILVDVDPNQRVSCDELFGPAVAVTPCSDIAAAIQLANSSQFGLSASIFTRDLDRAMRFVHEVDAGCLHVNWGTQWRADLMPYGGLKQSGFGKEGPRSAVLEMSEEKMVVIHGNWTAP